MLKRFNVIFFFTFVGIFYRMKLDLNKILSLLGVVVNFTLVLFGCVLLFTNYFSYVPSDMKKIVGIILLAYGLIRVLSLLSKLKEKNHEA